MKNRKEIERLVSSDGERKRDKERDGG